MILSFINETFKKYHLNKIMRQQQYIYIYIYIYIKLFNNCTMLNGILMESGALAPRMTRNIFPRACVNEIV